MTLLDDANSIITNLVKPASPVPANNILEETDEDKINSFADKLIKACAFVNAWSKQAFVLMIQNDILTLTTSQVVDGIVVTQPLFNLDNIINFPQGVLSWLIENGSDIDPDQETKFGDGTSFLQPYATTWIEAVFDIARYWDSNNITPSESILGGQSITFRDSPGSSFTKEKDDIQNYVPQDTRNKLFNAQWQAFIDGNDLPKTLNNNQFVKKTDLAVTNKNVANNADKIAEINVEILDGQSTGFTKVTDPATESLSGSAVNLQTARREDVQQIILNEFLINQNKTDVENVENQLNVFIFKLNKNGSTLIFSIPAGLHYFDWANWILDLRSIFEKGTDTTQLRLKDEAGDIAGSLLLNTFNLNLIIENLTGNDSGVLVLEAYDDNDVIIGTPTALTTINVQSSFNGDPVNFNLPIELTIPVGFKYFKLGVNVISGGYDIEITSLSFAKSIVENADGDLVIKLDDKLDKVVSGNLFKSDFRRDTNGQFIKTYTEIADGLKEKASFESSNSFRLRQSNDGFITSKPYNGGTGEDTIIVFAHMEEYFAEQIAGITLSTNLDINWETSPSNSVTVSLNSLSQNYNNFTKIIVKWDFNLDNAEQVPTVTPVSTELLSAEIVIGENVLLLARNGFDDAEREGQLNIIFNSLTSISLFSPQNSSNPIQRFVGKTNITIIGIGSSL